MTIAIFGATGRTGRELLKKAIDAGHSVNALARSPQKLFQFLRDLTDSGDFAPEIIKSFEQNRLKIVQGDAMDLEAVSQTIKGSEAVISVLGHADPNPFSAKKTPPNMQTIAIQNIISTMQETGIRRIIILTGSGVRFDGDKPSFIDRFVNSLLKIIAKDRILDGERHARVLAETDLDWTILRAFLLVNSLKSHGSATGLVGSPHTGLTVDRQIIADYMLNQINNPNTFKKAPYISN